MFEIAKKYMESSRITLICTFSRKAMVLPFFEALCKMDMPRDMIQLIIYNNSDSILLKEILTKAFNTVKDEFYSAELYQSQRRTGTTLRGAINKDFHKSKLKPIWDMWLDMKEMVKTEILFVMEDDTICPQNSFWTLLDDLLSLDNAGFVTGISTGRAPLGWERVRLGIHKMWVEGNHITKRISLDPNLKGIHEIDAAGVYCFMARTDVYKHAFDGMDKYVASTPFFGMDNILTYNMQRNGSKLYADFNVWCDHMQMTGDHLIPFNKKQAVQMADVWLPEFDNYGQGIEIEPKKGVSAISEEEETQKETPTAQELQDEKELKEAKQDIEELNRRRDKLARQRYHVEFYHRLCGARQRVINEIIKLEEFDEE